VKLVANDHERHTRFGQELCGAPGFIGIGPHPHAGIDQVLRNDLGAYAFVVVIGMPGDVGRTIGRGPRRLETAADSFRNHIRPARKPAVLGDRLDDLFLIGDLLETIAPGAPRLVAGGELGCGPSFCA
jgi:hypothetical protein